MDAEDKVRVVKTVYYDCCVVDCDSKRKDVKLHRFPASETGLKMWLDCINSDSLRSLCLSELRKHHVCQKHFEKRFVTPKLRLRIDAYPSLFSSEEIASGIPTKTNEGDESLNSNIEHSYARKRKHEDHTYFKQSTTMQPETLTDFSEPSTSGTTVDVKIGKQLQSPTREKMHYRDMVDENARELKETPKRNKESQVKTKSIRKRLFQNVKALTPNCSKLYKQYVKSRKQCKDFIRRAQRAVKFTESSSFEHLTQKMNPIARKILWMQITQATKKDKGRRFTLEEKLISLSIMKQSPKCYRFLQKIFILPSKTTLNKMISELKIGAGINTQIFKAIKKEVDTWEDNKKYCSIIFDEVALDEGLSYNKNSDEIDGFVHLNEKSPDFADHALVFMLRGAIFKWQQPIAFYFCKGATKGMELKLIVKDIIAAVIDTGLTPVALVCDQGSAFQATLKSLKEDNRREQLRAGENADDTVKVSGHTLHVIYDPPHLVKGLRNNFLNKNIKCDGKTSKWSDIVDTYKADCNHAEYRLLHKLNDEMVIPEKIKKMKVKNCTRVFSATMASALALIAQFSHYVDGRNVSPTTMNTAEIVSFFDKLFDSVNGATLNHKKCKKPLRKAVTSSSPHHAFWNEAIKKLERIQFVDQKGRESSAVPSLRNWISTLKNFQKLWQFLKEKNIKIMRPRYFNSDPIENFFGQVRAYSYRNNNPNCHSFTSTFRSLLITRFIKFHSETFNCENESGDQLLKLQMLFAPIDNVSKTGERLTSSVQHPTCSIQEMEEIPEFRPENIQEAIRRERLNIHARAYTVGWVIRKILAKIDCEGCKTNLTSSEDEDIHKWITIREYKCLKEKKLTYPSEQAVRCFGALTDLTNGILECDPHRGSLVKHIKKSARSKISFDFLNCEEHADAVTEYFASYTITLSVFNWCNIINKILKGIDIVRLEGRNLPPMQLKAINKFKTKLRNKKFNK